jgi:glucokinase
MTRLLADIGGTYARFALRGPDGAPVEERTLATADYPGPVEAARAYLDGLPGGVAPTEGVFAGAGPVEGDRIALTNCPWRFSVEATRRALGLRRLVAINDFVAQALAIPVLAPDELIKLGDRGEPVPGRAIGVIGAGTGLGVAGLLPIPSGWQPLPSEGGHVSFAPGDEVEAAVLRVLRGRFAGHVSNERLLTGGGLVNLATALAEIAGEGELGPLEPRDVTARAADGSCRFCAEAVRRFSGILGSAAGDLALVLLARGGVFLAGGVVPRLGPLFDVGLFRERFEAKGRFRDYLARVPTYLAARTDTGLLGTAALVLPAE